MEGVGEPSLVGGAEPKDDEDADGDGESGGDIVCTLHDESEEKEPENTARKNGGDFPPGVKRTLDADHGERGKGSDETEEDRCSVEDFHAHLFIGSGAAEAFHEVAPDEGGGTVER